MKLPITKYGVKEIILVALFSIIMGLLLIKVHSALIAVPLLLFSFVLYFFRDPVRVSPEGEHLVVAPADGRVVEISEVYENKFINQPSVKIGIFLSLFNVHINRAPYAGQVIWTNYQKGKFLVASDPRAGDLNENNSIGLLCAGSTPFKILIRQIAGIIARRIVCFCVTNDRVNKGDKIGLIKFGSRTELYLPKDKIKELKVTLNDRVKGGETIICHLH
ncbi:MAG: phosphatidylserine decarboxylase family protein [Planctomycetota bacterium]